MMAEMNEALAGTRAAVDDLLAAAERSASVWTTPRAPGKWSPSQIVEHVAMTLDESANAMAGGPTKFPKLPVFVRPLVRTFVFNRVLRTGAFPRAKSTKAFDPATGPATPAEARARLDAVVARFDRACRDRAAAGGPFASTIFGRVSVEDYVRFQAIHVRHHRRQMPDAS
jgi:hypothetical protein